MAGYYLVTVQVKSEFMVYFYWDVFYRHATHLIWSGLALHFQPRPVANAQAVPAVIDGLQG